MPRPDHRDHVEIVFDDQPVEMDIEQVEPRRGAPMAEQPRLDVGQRERAIEQRVGAQVNLPDRQIIGGAPIAVHPPQQIGRERAGDGGTGNGRAGAKRGGERIGHGHSCAARGVATVMPAGGVRRQLREIRGVV
ncbi:hypothetical protein D9M73_119680 [compost metagenome]